VHPEHDRDHHHHHHHHHKHQGLDPLIRSVSRVTAAHANARYWPQGLLSMPTDNSHKSWEIPSDKTSVSSARKSDFLTSSIVIPGQCNFSCSREERMKASPPAPQNRDLRLREHTPTENGHVWRT